MLLNMNVMLKVAKENKFGVPAFNIGSDTMLKAVMGECIATNSPVILAIHPDELEYVGDEFARFVVEQAKKAPIPVVVHLDHGTTVDQIVRAIKCGFSSVMIDASLASMDDNIKLSKEVVSICKGNNISVEGELGTIGSNAGNYETVANEIIYTDPKDVVKFINETGVDTLAIAIGTAHGLYPKDLIPELRLDILEEITKVSDAYLVLHGGSNNKDEEIAKAVEIGVQKVNISSDYKAELYRSTREYLINNPAAMEPHTIYKQSTKDAQKVIKHKLDLLNTTGKADLF